MPTQEKSCIDYNLLSGNALDVPQKSKAKTDQKNLALQTDLLHEFTRFCAARGLAEGRFASAAILLLMQTGADEREKVMLALDEWVQQRAKGNPSPQFPVRKIELPDPPPGDDDPLPALDAPEGVRTRIQGHDSARGRGRAPAGKAQAET
jgi:hypothetical protein